MRSFVAWYNHEHKHLGLALLPPEVVHSGRAAEVLAKRQQALDAAYAAHPERFPRGRPRVGQLPKEVGINLPRPLVGEPTTATAEAQPAAPPASRARSAATLDAGGAVGQAAPAVLALERTNAPHFA